MGFSATQVQALRRNLDRRHICTRETNGRGLTYMQGWHAIAEANRIFGFDGWSRETIESRWAVKTAVHSLRLISPKSGSPSKQSKEP